MTKYKDGEYIDLHWEYRDPEVYYVKGHVDEVSFRAALENSHGDGFFYGEDEIGLRHAYAFWAMDGNADDVGGQVMRECPRRRGAFKVTAMDVPTERERAKKRLDKLQARVAHHHIRLKSGADGTTWPWPWSKGPFLDRISPAHKARYAPETLTKKDAMELAGIADAYTTLITHPCREVRDKMHELHVAYELWCAGVLPDSTPAPVATPHQPDDQVSL